MFDQPLTSNIDAKYTNFNIRDTVLAKDVNKKNKLASDYEPKPYTVLKTYHRNIKITNGIGSLCE